MSGTGRSVRFAEEVEEHPVSPRTKKDGSQSLVDSLLRTAGMGEIADAAAVDDMEEEIGNLVDKGKGPAEGGEVTQRQADAQDKDDIDRLADMGMSRVQHDVDEDSGGSDDDEGREVAAKYDVLDTTAIDGVEARTLNYNEAGIKITPFNLEEEEEEGHFDNDGNFVWNKGDEGRDAWLDTVDWNREMPDQQEGLEDDGDEVEEVSQHEQLNTLLAVLHPGETVAKALKRLGGGVAGARKWQKKKAGAPPDPPRDEAGIVRVTEAADKLLQSGYFDVYSSTYEEIKAYRDNEAGTGVSRITIKRGLSETESEGEDDDGEEDSEGKGSKTKKSSSSKYKKNRKKAKPVPVGNGEAQPAPAAPTDAGLDMYADDDVGNGQSTGGLPPEPAESTSGNIASDEVMWEYRWLPEDGADVYGPYSSEVMRDWKDGGMFNAGFYVRKVGENRDFYNGARIDFDLFV